MAELTAEQQDLLLHMTGLDRHPEPYRSHAAADPDSTLWRTLKTLEALGLVTPPVEGGDVYGGLVFFYTTKAGVETARRIASGKAPG